MQHGLWHTLITRFLDSDAPTQSPYPRLTTPTWLTKPSWKPGPGTPQPSPKARSPNPILFWALPCASHREFPPPRDYHIQPTEPSHSPGPIPLPSWERQPYIVQGTPFSSPHGVASNPRGHHHPRPQCLPGGDYPFQGNHLVPVKRFAQLPGGDHPSRGTNLLPPRSSFHSLGETNLLKKPHLLPAKRFLGDAPFPYWEVHSIPWGRHYPPNALKFPEGKPMHHELVDPSK
jgi:hypothetical protein